jgi:alanine racemase
MSASSRAWLEISLNAIRDNARALTTHAGTRLAPVLKADAYGLGAVAVAQALEPLDPWGYCVATPEEGAALRAAGITRPLLSCPPLMPSEAQAHLEAGLTPAIGTPDALDAWIHANGGAWHLSVDTGMARAGAPWHTMAAWRARLAKHPPEGVFTHFHSADIPNDTMADQEHRFAAALAELPSRPALVHTDNSAAAARRPAGEQASDLVRAGVFLYGVSTGVTAQLHPQPVVSLHARIMELHDVATGDTVGYAGGWVAPSARRIATVGVGYADGLRRAWGRGGMALVRGRRVPLTGWITMDMTMLDVTDTGASTGDVVTLLGADPAAPYGTGDSAPIRVAEAAEWSGCSPYELLVGLKLRVPRQYAGA